MYRKNVFRKIFYLPQKNNSPHNMMQPLLQSTVVLGSGSGSRNAIVISSVQLLLKPCKIQLHILAIKIDLLRIFPPFFCNAIWVDKNRIIFLVLAIQRTLLWPNFIPNVLQTELLRRLAVVRLGCPNRPQWNDLNEH